MWSLSSQSLNTLVFHTRIAPKMQPSSPLEPSMYGWLIPSFSSHTYPPGGMCVQIGGQASQLLVKILLSKLITYHLSIMIPPTWLSREPLKSLTGFQKQSLSLVKLETGLSYFWNSTFLICLAMLFTFLYQCPLKGLGIWLAIAQLGSIYFSHGKFRNSKSSVTDCCKKGNNCWWWRDSSPKRWVIVGGGGKLTWFASRVFPSKLFSQNVYRENEAPFTYDFRLTLS